MNRRSRLALWLSLATCLLLATQAFAQIPTATLIGRVTSESGEGLPGVLVSASSASAQGVRTGYTGGNGDYKIPFLPPGVYKVTYQLDGFTEVETELKASAAQTATSNVKMRASEVVEETIVVTSNYETISQTAEGSATFTNDEVEKLAIERDVDSAALLAPGVTATGPGSTEEAPRITISGAMSFENLFLVNGVVINENIRGQELPLFIEDAIEETTTSVSSVSAEYGRFTGGVVNVITKSGGNQIEGSLRTSLSNDDWIARAEGQGPAFTGSPIREDTINDTLEGTFGGAFWKDHLWFFGAGRDRATSSTGTTRAVTNISYPTTSTEERLEGKLTLAATSKHNLVASYIEVDAASTNSSFGTFIDLASLNNNRTDPQEIKSANYNGILSSNFFLEAQYSERDFIIGVGSGGVPDLIEGTLMRRRGTSHRFHAPTFCGSCEDELRNNENILAKGSYFLTTKGAGTHDMVFGYDTFDDIRFAVNHQTGSDFTVYASDIVVDANNNIFPIIDTADNVGTSRNTWIRWFAILNLDIAAPTSFKTNSFYVNDSWQLNDKWSFNLGLRYDENDGTNSAGALVTDDSKVSPRLSMTYDVKGDGDLQLNASYATYVAGIANSRADSTSDGGAVSSFRFDYGGPSINADTSLCNAQNTSGCLSTEQVLALVFDWYRSVGGTGADGSGLIPGESPFDIDPNSELWQLWRDSIGIPGATEQILGGLSSPSTDEITVGVVKRLGSKGTFRADVVYRDWTDFYSNRLTQAQAGAVTLESGAVADLTEVGNFGNDDLERTYTGLHTQFRYRLTDRLQIAANYSLSKVDGNINGESGTGGPATSSPNVYPEYREARWNTPKGALLTDQTHKLRAWAVYDLIDSEHHSLSVSVMQNFFSGSPYGAADGVVTSDFVTNTFGYVDVVGEEFTYFFTDRDAFETDDLTRTDLSFNYSFRWNAFGRSMQIFVQPEILNLFDESAVVGVNSDTNLLASFNPFTETPVEGVHWEKGANFGQPENEDDIQRPRLFRVSIGFRF